MRPAMPSVVGQWAHIVGAEPTWIYLPNKPDYSKHVEARKPDSSSSDDPEGEESEEETVEVEETDEEEQRSPSPKKSSGRGRGKGPPEGHPCKGGSLRGTCPRTSTAPRRSGPLLPHLRPGNGRSPCSTCHRTSAN